MSDIKMRGFLAAARSLSPLLFGSVRYRPICSSRILWQEAFASDGPEYDDDSRFQNPSLSGDEDGDAHHLNAESPLSIPSVLRAYLRSRRARCVSRVREQGRIPALLVDNDGSGRPDGRPTHIFLSLEAKPITALVKLMGKRDFISRVFDMNIYRNPESEEIKESLQVLPRNLNYGPGKTNILNIQFVKANTDQNLKLSVPLEYLGIDNCPGLRKGGTLVKLAKYIVYNCKANEVPAKIVVDMTVLEIGDRVLIQDLEVDFDHLHSERTMPVCEIVKDVESLKAKAKRLKSEIFHKRKAIREVGATKKVQSLSEDETDANEDDEGPFIGRIRRSAIRNGKSKYNDLVNADLESDKKVQASKKKLKSTYKRKKASDIKQLSDMKQLGDTVSSARKEKQSNRRLRGHSSTPKKIGNPIKSEESSNRNQSKTNK